MSGLASVANPFDPDAETIQVFYITQDKHLAMAFRNSGTAATKETSYAPKSTDHAPELVNPSSLAVGYYQGSQFVVGFTAPKPATDPHTGGNAARPTSLNISIVSPVVKTLLSGLELKNTTLTFVANEKLASIWYLKGTERNNIQLKEYSIRDQVAGKSVKLDPLTGSALAGYVIDKTQFIVYQDADNKLREYENKTGNTPYVATQANPAKNTTLAVNFVPTKREVYLYYSNLNHELIRMRRSVDGSWAGYKKIVTDYEVGGASQLAVVFSNKMNHVFWVPPDSEENAAPVHVKDDLTD